jgi:hypothetical protein
VLKGSDEAEDVEAKEDKALGDFVTEDDRARADADTRKAMAATASKTAAAAARSVVEGPDSVRFGPILNANRVLHAPSVTRKTTTGLAAHAGGTGLSYIEYQSEMSGAERLRAADAAARGGGGGGAKKPPPPPAPSSGGGGGGGGAVAGLFD